MVKIFYIVIIVVGFTACSVSKPAAQQGPAQISASQGCGQEGALPLDWRIVQDITLKEPGDGRKLPLKYEVYTVDQDQAAAFFEDIQKNKGGRMTLPMPADVGCRTFTLMPSGTLNAALAAKYPKLVSLKGAEEKEKLNTVRLDYDGEKINAEISWNYKVFIIQPWRDNDTLYYLVSRAEDTGYEKVPFEKPGTGGYKK